MVIANACSAVVRRFCSRKIMANTGMNSRSAYFAKVENASRGVPSPYSVPSASPANNHKGYRNSLILNTYLATSRADPESAQAPSVITSSTLSSAVDTGIDTPSATALHCETRLAPPATRSSLMLRRVFRHAPGKLRFYRGRVGVGV